MYIPTIEEVPGVDHAWFTPTSDVECGATSDRSLMTPFMSATQLLNHQKQLSQSSQEGMKHHV
jgi:hypothetical protein